MPKRLLKFQLGEKSVIWIQEVNKYIVTERIAAEIIGQLENRETTKNIVDFCSRNMNIKTREAKSLVTGLRKQWEEIFQSNTQSNNKTKEQDVNAIDKPFSRKYYRINDVVFYTEYGSALAEYYNHPKFAHLETTEVLNYNHCFQLSESEEKISLFVNGKLTGSWKKEDNHFLSGKFSMEILQKIYRKEEKLWMGVFHAAGISNGKNCLIFLGDSGNGKSTLSALLMACGFDVLSDDFLPVEGEHNVVCRFPSALSIKKEAFNMLIPKFPDLKQAEQYENSAFQKTFRYLAPSKTELTGVPCKGLVFVKYERDSGFNLEKMQQEEAFTHLIPDSWIEPSAENAKRFMNWFLGLPCYRLIYSDNNKLIETVEKMLSDELF